MKVRDESTTRELTAYKAGQVFDTDGDVFWVVTSEDHGVALIDVRKDRLVSTARNLDELFELYHDSADRPLSAELLIADPVKPDDLGGNYGPSD